MLFVQVISGKGDKQVNKYRLCNQVLLFKMII